MDRSLPGSSVHGIFQARVLEWVAIVFSGPEHLRHIKIVMQFLKKYPNRYPGDKRFNMRPRTTRVVKKKKGAYLAPS